MNDRWKMIMDCTVSQIALVLLFGGLVTVKIAELNNFGNLEMAASLVSASAFIFWAMWATVVSVKKQKIEPMAVTYRFITETICIALYISYLFMLGGVKGVIIWIPVAILVETHIIKELKDKTNKM